MKRSRAVVHTGSIISHTKIIEPPHDESQIVNDRLIVSREDNTIVFHSLKTGLPIAQSKSFDPTHNGPIYCYNDEDDGDDNRIIISTKSGTLAMIDTSGQMIGNVLQMNEDDNDVRDFVKIDTFKNDKKYSTAQLITLTNNGVYIERDQIIPLVNPRDMCVYNASGIIGIIHNDYSVHLYKNFQSIYDRMNDNDAITIPTTTTTTDTTTNGGSSEFKEMTLICGNDLKALQISIQSDELFWILTTTSTHHNSSNSNNYNNEYTISLYSRKRSEALKRHVFEKGTRIHFMKSFTQHQLFIVIYELSDGMCEVLVDDSSKPDLSQTVYQFPTHGTTQFDSFYMNDKDIFKNRLSTSEFEFRVRALTHGAVFEFEWKSSETLQLIQCVQNPNQLYSTTNNESTMLTGATVMTLDILLNQQLISVVNNALLEVEENEMQEEIYRLDNPMYILNWIKRKSDEIWEEVKLTKSVIIEQGPRCLDPENRDSMHNSLSDSNRKYKALVTILDVLSERATSSRELEQLANLLNHRATSLDVLATLLGLGYLPLSRIAYNPEEILKRHRAFQSSIHQQQQQQQQQLSKEDHIDIFDEDQMSSSSSSSTSSIERLLLLDCPTVRTFSFINHLLSMDQNMTTTTTTMTTQTTIMKYPPDSIADIINLFENVNISVLKSHLITFYFLVDLESQKDLSEQFSAYAKKFRISEQWQKCIIGGWLCDTGKIAKGVEFLLQTDNCLTTIGITDSLVAWLVYLGYYNSAKSIIRIAGFIHSESHYYSFLAELGNCSVTLNAAFRHCRQFDRKIGSSGGGGDRKLLRILCEYCMDNKLLAHFFALPFTDEESKFIQLYLHSKRPDLEFQYLIIRGRTREASLLKDYLEGSIHDQDTNSVLSKLASGVKKVTPQAKFNYPHLFNRRSTSQQQQAEQQQMELDD